MEKHRLEKALQAEAQAFTETYFWLETEMPSAFFQELTESDLTAVIHALTDIEKHDYFSSIHFEDKTVAFSPDSKDADLRILQENRLQQAKTYQTFTSKTPFRNSLLPIRIAIITTLSDPDKELPLTRISDIESKYELFSNVHKKKTTVTEEEFDRIFALLPKRFLDSLSKEKKILSLETVFEAETTDIPHYAFCEEEKSPDPLRPSLRLVFAKKGRYRPDSFYQTVKRLQQYGFRPEQINAAYLRPDSPNGIIVMSLTLEEIVTEGGERDGSPEDMLRALFASALFEDSDGIETTFAESGILEEEQTYPIRLSILVTEQILRRYDPYAYERKRIEEELCKKKEIVADIARAFEKKFHPEKTDAIAYSNLIDRVREQIEQVKSEESENGKVLTTLLEATLRFVTSCIKTNFYRIDKTAFCFRFDPEELLGDPMMNHPSSFPSMPYGIFFLKGADFFGFHIRFSDLARGGLRTVIGKNTESGLRERSRILTECYRLAHTQEKKNKDIPEGGSKGVIFLEPGRSLSKEETTISLHAAQRAYVYNLLTLINCREDGSLKARRIVDYYQKPEYLYLGPDENMHDVMIDTIADLSHNAGYRPGKAFISGKPDLGINHKEFGVTSLGLHVYVEKILERLGIDPRKDPFTVKMTGGPDGDVAGNQMKNFLLRCPTTAKLLTTVDVSGLVFDPNGLDLPALGKLFKEGKPIRYYPVELLSEGGFLLDTQTEKEENGEFLTSYTINRSGIPERTFIPLREKRKLLREHIHRTQADLFIPAGGRPGTLGENTVQDFFCEDGTPSSKAIVEGANLYLTEEARSILQRSGVLIVKDSSANKGGVICSSFEVLAGLCLTEEEFRQDKTAIVEQILTVVQEKSKKEIDLLLSLEKTTGKFLTELSDLVSEGILRRTEEILSYLAVHPLSPSPSDPLNKVLFAYVLPLLREKYPERVLERIPDMHKKAIIAVHLASELVYAKGPDWNPSVGDILPALLMQYT